MFNLLLEKRREGLVVNAFDSGRTNHLSSKHTHTHSRSYLNMSFRNLPVNPALPPLPPSTLIDAAAVRRTLRLGGSHARVCRYVVAYVHMHVCMYVCLHVCMCVCACMHACMHACTHKQSQNVRLSLSLYIYLWS